MSAGMPELGSKISLISKADIRYEGRLFTVDPKECTIALSSVRSFGTEDRETPYPVPAQNQVYDYILFRGSDIKDIRVVNNVTQPLNDPAIMQLSVPPSSIGQQSFQSHPMLGHMGGGGPPQMGQFAAGGYGGPMGAMGPAGLSGGLIGTNMGRGGVELIMPPPSGGAVGEQSLAAVLSPAAEPSGRPNDHHHDLIGAGSRSTTPASLGSRKSPTNDQGVQAGGSGKRDDKRMKPIQPPGGGQRQQRKSTSQERRRSSQGDGGHQQQQDYHQRNQNRGPPQNRNMQMGGGGPHLHHQQHHQGGGPHQPHHHQQQQHQQQRQQPGQGGWINRGPQMRQRGRPRPNYNNKPNGGQHTPGQKTKLKFENDYDFEQANTEFEELRNQLSKVKIDGEPTNAAAAPTTADGAVTDADAAAATTVTIPQVNKALIEVVNGDVDKKDDSGNETGAGETEQEEEHEVFYDKSKSFFDKISCEAVERAKGKSQRTDWRTERKLNSETFGVAATRRGNFRGRGGYRGGMGYRGGFRGGYRPQQRRDQQGGGRPGQQHQNNDQQQRSNMQPTAVPLPVATGS